MVTRFSYRVDRVQCALCSYLCGVGGHRHVVRGYTHVNTLLQLHVEMLRLRPLLTSFLSGAPGTGNRKRIRMG